MKPNIILKSNIYPVQEGNPLDDLTFTSQISDPKSLENALSRRVFNPFPLTRGQERMVESGRYCSWHPEFERVFGEVIRGQQTKVAFRCSYLMQCEYAVTNGCRR